MTIERASDNPFPSILMVEGDPEALATDAAAGQRRLAVGTDHLLYLVDDAGVATPVGSSGITEITDLPTAETDDTLVLAPDGAGGVEWVTPGGGSADPPGYEIDYAQVTSPVSISSTSSVSPDTVVSGASKTFDGGPVIVEISAPWQRGGTGGNPLIHQLWLDGSVLADMGRIYTDLTPGPSARIRLTPSAGSHTFVWRAYFAFANTGTRQIEAGAGTGGGYKPAFIRITKV